MKPSAPLDRSSMAVEVGFADRVAEARTALQHEMQPRHDEPGYRVFTDDERADLLRHAVYHARVLTAQAEREAADRV